MVISVVEFKYINIRELLLELLHKGNAQVESVLAAREQAAIKVVLVVDGDTGDCS